MFEKLRHPVSGLTHLGAAVVAAGGLVALLYLGRESTTKEIALLVYGSTLVLMFSASAAYHLIPSKPSVIQFLRKIDHASIYLLIAGTYTPFCLHFFSGFWREGLLAIIWIMAITGIGVKVFVINAPRWITAGVYLVMGWLSLAAIQEMRRVLPAGAMMWLVLGGSFFTLGAVVYITKRPDFFPNLFGFHEIWHIFVILGCLSHFIAVAVYVAPHPTAS